MAILGDSSGTKKTDLTNIIVIEKNNSRKKYPKNKIIERARSIEALKQLAPIILQKSEKYPGKFILVSGFCRYKAHEFLISEGKPYTQIDYVIITGDPFLINLAENIQRSQLDSEEIEIALKHMIDQGKKPQQIANEIDKSLSWVCDRLKAGEVRAVIEVDSENISSTALSHLRNLPKKTINKIIPEIKENGGTVDAARNAVKNIKSKNEKLYINKPENKDPFSDVYDQIKLLIRLDIDKKEIIETITKYIEGLK